MAPQCNISTNQQTGKFWSNGHYQEAKIGYDGSWWTQNPETGKWEKVDKNTVIFQFNNPWDNVYSGLEKRRNNSLAYIEHCEEEKTLADKAANFARGLKQGFTANFNNACNGIKEAKIHLEALFPNNQDTKGLSSADQSEAKKLQQIIKTEEGNRDVAQANMSAQSSAIRTNEAWYRFMCQQQMNEYLGPLADVSNLESVADKMQSSV